jgi:hypothetical protein
MRELKVWFMSATQVIEEFERLPPEERRKVVAYIHEVERAGGVSEEFKRMADEVFKANDELFRKLAQ